MNPDKIVDILQELRMLPFFPNDEFVMIGLVRMVGSMCETEEQVSWLVARMTSGLYAQWPGPQEMRACYCSKFRPKDGQNAFSTVYLDGIPSEKTNRPAIAGPELKRLPPIEVDRDLLTKAEPRTEPRQMGKFQRPVTKTELDRCPQWLKDLCGYKG